MCWTAGNNRAASVEVQSSREMRPRRFPAPRKVQQIPGGYKVLDASGQSLAYVYGRKTKADATDEARRVASNIAKVPKLLGKG